MTPDKIGRNNPCPCGSGKKFKRCCLLGKVHAGLEAERFHRLAHGLLPELGEFAWSVLKKAAADAARRAFWPRRGKTVPEDREVGLFHHWVYFDWKPGKKAWRARVDLPKDGALADAFLVAAGDSLVPDAVEAAGALLRTPSSFHEMLEVVPGRGLRARELFLGLEFDIDERAGSRQLQRGDLLYAKVVPWRETFVLAGVGDIPIPPSYKPLLIRLRQDLRLRFKQLTPVHLRIVQDTLRCTYLDMQEQLLDERFPQLANSDGDPLSLHELHYEIDSPHEAAIALSELERSPAREDKLKGCDRDEDGRVVSGEIVWCRPGDTAGMGMAATTLGFIRIDGTRMTVEVNSARRAARIRKEITRLLGDGARFRNAVIQDGEQVMQQAAERRDAGVPAGGVADEVEQTPEVRAAMQEFLERHYRDWVDHPLPALGGKTPREAVRDPDGREMVEALLLDFDRGRQGGMEFDFDRLRKELGLI